MIILKSETLPEAIQEWNSRFDQHVKNRAIIKVEFEKRSNGLKGQMNKSKYEALQQTFAREENSWKETGFKPFLKWFPNWDGWSEAVKKAPKGPWLELA